MDPSIQLCTYYDSLLDVPPQENPADLAAWYHQPIPIELTGYLSQVPLDQPEPPLYIDTNLYLALRGAKDQFTNPNFPAARDATNPFETIGRSIFMNRAAIKIANIDAVHAITNIRWQYDQRTSPHPFTFCDVAAGPGGFTQYMQYRFPSSRGYGMTLKIPGLDWSTQYLNTKRFDTFYGTDGTGDLYINWDSFISHVLHEQPSGVELVMGDGGFDLDDPNNLQQLHSQEFLSSRLLLTQSLVGVSCTASGGNFVLKLFDTVTQFSAHVLFVLAQAFERIQMFKPCSSRPANAERYLICMNRRPDVRNITELLKAAALAYTDTLYLSSLFSDPLPHEFETWLRAGNLQSIERQLHSAQQIIQHMGGVPPPIPWYNIPKFLIIWNLPENSSSASVIKLNYRAPRGGGRGRGRGRGRARGRAQEQ